MLVCRLDCVFNYIKYIYIAISAYSSLVPHLYNYNFVDSNCTYICECIKKIHSINNYKLINNKSIVPFSSSKTEPLLVSDNSCESESDCFNYINNKKIIIIIIIIITMIIYYNQ